ncbi:MAG: dTMP kinase [Candidatus Parvarchaeota archaeon]
MNGKLVDFEGIDKAGKSTQIRRTVALLKRMHIKNKVYKYPSKNNVYGKLLRDFIRNKVELNEYEQVMLFLLDMSMDQPDLTKKLREGYTVILDRYFVSTLAYQTKDGVGCRDIKEIIRILRLRKPDAVIYLDIPPETSLRRLRTGKAERFEGDLKRLKRIRENYLKLKKERFPTKNWITVDASNDIDEVNLEVSSRIKSIIKSK